MPLSSQVDSDDDSLQYFSFNVEHVKKGGPPVTVYVCVCVGGGGEGGGVDKIWVHTQGCGNTMPDFSNLVPFHSGQVDNFNLLVLGQVQNLYKVNKILYLIF